MIDRATLNQSYIHRGREYLFFFKREESGGHICQQKDDWSCQIHMCWFHLKRSGGTINGRDLLFRLETGLFSTNKLLGTGTELYFFPCHSISHIYQEQTDDRLTDVNFTYCKLKEHLLPSYREKLKYWCEFVIFSCESNSSIYCHF